MKKSILSIVALAATLTMAAEGYQVNTLSAKQEGMGHVGAGLKLGAESMIFNPAGMAFMDKTIDLSASVSGIISDVTATTNGTEYETNNDVSTPFHISGAFSIYDNLKAGITINTPYGSGIDWGNNWPGSMLNQSVKLQVFNIQPTVAYKILPNLSVGAGLMIAWGKIDLNKGLVNPASVDKIYGTNFGNTAPASVNLTGTAEVVLGFNVGAMWDINEKITVGANYRSKMDMKVKSGDAKLTYANEVAEQILGSLTGLNGANFSAQLPAVSVLTMGVSYKPIQKLTLAFDAQLSFWSKYKRLNINFLDDKLTPFNQSLPKNYNDAWAFRLGAEYALTNRFDIRAGFVVDTTPVDENYFNPETPGMTRLLPSIGFSFRPTPRLSIDFAFTYVAGLSRDGSNTYDDLVAKTAYGTAYSQAYEGAIAQGLAADAANAFAQQTAEGFLSSKGLNLQETFSAEYGINAFIPAIGVSYSF
ncbi:MAG: outer membrane protein transport protein [Muribaculaceae bacterium]|nr:outer membrane protein transport protein [Muribaculaceae bacterium]